MADGPLVEIEVQFVDVKDFEFFKLEVENALGVGRFSFKGSQGKQFRVTKGSELICENVPVDTARFEGKYNAEFNKILEKLKSLS